MNGKKVKEKKESNRKMSNFLEVGAFNTTEKSSRANLLIKCHNMWQWMTEKSKKVQNKNLSMK